jgi:hypothetical protein
MYQIVSDVNAKEKTEVRVYDSQYEVEKLEKNKTNGVILEIL